MIPAYVYYNKSVINEENVNIGLRSKAFNYGLGCFEGIRAYWNEDAKQLKEHYMLLAQGGNQKYLNYSTALQFTKI